MEALNFIKAWLVSVVSSFQKKNAAWSADFRASVVSYAMQCGLKASVAAVIGELVTGVVMMFVGLFMLDSVYGAIGITNVSPFYGISVQLLATTGTIFSVLGVVIIIIALATGIGALKNMF